ncbi:MAG TPA: hypothetical protein VFB75_15995, partial [Burkholderiales bacterium]|nr:hypothetical protein [Burkholderiales bacterium]
SATSYTMSWCSSCRDGLLCAFASRARKSLARGSLATISGNTLRFSHQKAEQPFASLNRQRTFEDPQ